MVIEVAMYGINTSTPDSSERLVTGYASKTVSRKGATTPFATGNSGWIR